MVLFGVSKSLVWILVHLFEIEQPDALKSNGQRSTHAHKRCVGAKITLIQLKRIVRRRMPLPVATS